jgi:ABC-2 type transport system permease protein
MSVTAFPSSRPAPSARTAIGAPRPLVALAAIVHREALRFLGQRGRLIAALVRPLVWLLVFAAGFRAALGLSITPPYKTYISYDLYIVPGLLGMILLFNGMQSSLSLVYDREMGSMRLLLTAPLPRWWVLLCRLFAASLISVLQAYAFLAIAAVYGIRFSPAGYLAALPAIALAALMLAALGVMLSSLIRQLENFAGVMNFVIFPMFFLSSALYPLEDGRGVGPLARPLRRQPFHPCGRTHPLCPLPPAEPDRAGRYLLHARRLRRRRALGLRPGPRPGRAQGLIPPRPSSFLTFRSRARLMHMLCAWVAHSSGRRNAGSLG